jgi:hypothetical protein
LIIKKHENIKSSKCEVLFMKKMGFIFAVVFGGAALTVIFSNFLPMPFIWISFLWFVVFLILAKISSKKAVKLFLYYFSFIPFTFGIFETGQWVINKPMVQTDLPEAPIDREGFREIYPRESINIKDEILGYAPLPDTKPRHIKYYRDELIFDVVYTIDGNGLRKSPPYQSDKDPGSILFFGDSFTFGEGVKDEETLPYLTGVKTRGKYHIYNFGFRGYGTHQMLSAIEHGLIEKVVKEPPKFVIYQANFYAIGRAAGLRVVEWDDYGPKYILKENGDVVYAGHFNKEDQAVDEPIISGLNKSRTLRRLFLKRKGYNQGQVDLFIGIVDKSRKLIETRYPGCEFHVLLFDNPRQGNNDYVIKEFNNMGIRLHGVREIYKNIPASFEHLPLTIKYDGHPSPAAYDILSDYVVDKIIHKRE